MLIQDGDKARGVSLGLFYAQGGWQNRILARALNEMASYNPIRHVAAVQAPVLMVVATNDTLCPIAMARKAAALNSRVRCAAVTWAGASHC